MSWSVYSKVINITVVDSHTIIIQKTENRAHHGHTTCCRMAREWKPVFKDGR